MDFEPICVIKPYIFFIEIGVKMEQLRNALYEKEKIFPNYTFALG
jgi:hypothetical protein